MTAKPDAQRRREADERKRANGLVRVSVWVPVESKERIQSHAQHLCRLQEKKKPQGDSGA